MTTPENLRAEDERALRTRRQEVEADTERLDWLEKQDGSALVSDDAGHWAVSTTGVQNVPMNPPEDIDTSFWIEKAEWCKTVREAIDRAIRDEAGPIDCSGNQ